MNALLIAAIVAWSAAEEPKAPDKLPAELLVQLAFQAAAEKVAPAVATVEVAELDLIDDEPTPKKDPKADPKAKMKKAPARGEDGFLRAEDAPSTALVVSADGWVVTSTFNLGKNPKYIKVRLHDGREFPATMHGRDLSRGIALLKIPAEKLAVAAVADVKAARVGQWTLALGRSFGGQLPSVQYGILSAKERIMGRALQTDCALSPANYGGPLIDIEGRVMAINVPLSPQGDAIETGLYDSGIGFAVPLSDILANLDRLKKGETLHPGFLGVLFNADRTDGAELKDVVKDGPAAKGGLEKGDIITHVAGVAVDSSYRFQFEIGKRLAGDKVELTVKRKDKTIKAEVTLGRRPA